MSDHWQWLVVKGEFDVQSTALGIRDLTVSSAVAWNSLLAFLRVWVTSLSLASFAKHLSPIYTIQPVVKPVVNPVWQPGKCLYTRYNRLSNRLSIRLPNLFDNRLYRVYSRLSNRFDNLFVQPGCQTGCQTRLTTGLTTVLNEQSVRSRRLSNRVCQTGLTNTVWQPLFVQHGCQTGAGLVTLNIQRSAIQARCNYSWCGYVPVCSN